MFLKPNSTAVIRLRGRRCWWLML